MQEINPDISDERIFQLEKNLPPSAVLGSYGVDVVANHLHQDILRNMGMAREVLFHALGIDYCIMEKVLNDDQKADPRFAGNVQKSKDWLYEVLRKTIFVLSAFADGSNKNQQVLFSKLDIFRERLGDKVTGDDSEESLFCWDVVISIFQGNEKLVRVCPESLVAQYTTLLADSMNAKNRCRLLDFFINICNPTDNGKAIVRNQDLCLKFLLGSFETYGKPLLKYHFAENIGGADLDETETEALEVAKCLQVLAYCSKDKNNLAVAKCQAQLTIDEVCDLYKADKKGDEELTVAQGLYFKSTIMDFLQSCYVDTPLRDRNLERMEKFWFVLEDATTILIEGWKGDHWSCEVEEPSLTLNESFGGNEPTGDSESEFIREKFAKSILSLAASFFSSKNCILGDAGGWLQDKNHFTYKTWIAVSNCCKFISRSNGDTDFVITRASKDALANIAVQILDDFEITVDPMAATGMFMPRSKSFANEQLYRARSETRAALTREERMMASTKEEKQLYLFEVANALATSKRAQDAVGKRDHEFIEALEQMENVTDPEDAEYTELATDFKENHQYDTGVGNDDEDEDEDEDEDDVEGKRDSDAASARGVEKNEVSPTNSVAGEGKAIKRKRRQSGVKPWLRRRERKLRKLCAKFLKISEGIPMISWVLFLVAVATITTGEMTRQGAKWSRFFLRFF